MEASRLCFLPEARRDVLCRLMATVGTLADRHDAAWVVACPREEHALFYPRMFGFHQLGEPRTYFGVNFRTALLSVPLSEIRATVERSRPFRTAWSALQGWAACPMPRLATVAA